MGVIDGERWAEPRHGPDCSIVDLPAPGEQIDYAKACAGFHCVWCGEPCSSHGCGCEWSERRVVRPDDSEGPSWA